MKRKQQPSTSKPQRTQRDDIDRILHLPRLVRIGLIAIPALAMAIVATPIVDYVYLRFFFHIDTRIVPSIITGALGVIMYAVGWVLIVGVAGETPAPNRVTLRRYLIVAMLLVLAAIFWWAYLTIAGHTAT